uniref:Uncharacterized protein n=1 Tax=Ditylenchus dipsaci TaxID=166011 RepID=A0A915E4A8_9BILA
MGQKQSKSTGGGKANEFDLSIIGSIQTDLPVHLAKDSTSTSSGIHNESKDIWYDCSDTFGSIQSLPLGGLNPFQISGVSPLMRSTFLWVQDKEPHTGQLRGRRTLSVNGLKSYVSYQDYPSDILPPYVWGFFYGISNRAVKSILSVSHTVNGFSLDDLLYTGVLAEKAGVKVISATKYLELEFGDIEDKNRECDSKEKVPFVTALCCVDNPKKITNSFTIVKNVTCNSPVTVTPSIQQKV